jgi:hypothetical protein
VTRHELDQTSAQLDYLAGHIFMGRPAPTAISGLPAVP